MSRGGGGDRRAAPDIGGLTSLKIDNLSYQTTPNDLRRVFERYGEIGDVHIPRDKYSRQSKGFGFVRFYDRRDAEHAMDRTDGKNVDGRELRVTLAKYDRPSDERGGRGGNGGGRRRAAVEEAEIAELT
uniref:RRM domain-containing protein n=1 Tax=Caenorhabditis tropicalis TaxID=1561998 RepID=A0A1I7TSY2_9PELO